MNTLWGISGVETVTSNNIMKALKHCASKPNTEVAVIFFANDNFNIDIFNEGYRKYKGKILFYFSDEHVLKEIK